jgi:hypothetical protein
MKALWKVIDNMNQNKTKSIEVWTIANRLVGQLTKRDPKIFVLEVGSRVSAHSPYAAPKNLITEYVNGEIAKQAQAINAEKGLDWLSFINVTETINGRTRSREQHAIEPYELYIERLKQHYLRSLSTNPLVWRQLTTVPRMAIACERTVEPHAHRFIIREIIAAACHDAGVEFNYKGEILPNAFVHDPSFETEQLLNNLFP